MLIPLSYNRNTGALGYHPDEWGNTITLEKLLPQPFKHLAKGVKSQIKFAHAQKKESKECAQHKATLLANSQNKAALDDAWNRSLPGNVNTAREQGGLLGQTIDYGQPFDKEAFRVNERFTRRPYTSPAALEGFSNWAIDTMRRNRAFVAYGYWYHTHPHNEGDKIPNYGIVGNSEFPTGLKGDQGISVDLNLLGVLITKNRIVVFDKEGVIRCHFDK